MIDFINVKKGFADKDILKGANFRINKGEHVGVVGPNGAGKSSLFNMIIGDTEPDKGEINLPNDIRLGYLRQQLRAGEQDESLLEHTADALPELGDVHRRITRIESELATASNSALLDELGDLQTRYERLGGYEMTAKAEAALSGLGFKAVDFEKPLNSFSGGWQMRALLAQTLIVDPDLLLLDEPSNYLDVPAIEWIQRHLRNFKGTLLLISHDRYLLNSLTHVTIEVNAGLVNRYVGDYDYYVRERESRFHSLQAAKLNQDKRRQQLERSITRFRAKSTKAAQVQSWVKTIEKMEDIDIPDPLSYSGSIRVPAPPPSGAEMLRLEQVSHSYDGDRWILKDVDLRIERGDKIGIIGYNGMGKTTLLRIIAGELDTTEGKRVLGHKVVVGYQAQEFADILPREKRIFDIVADATPDGLADKDIRSVLGSFGFQGEAVHKQCEILSGGEKIRLAFARIFINPPNLLVLDEPTTHLDISAREGLQLAIQQYTGTICLVSHDIEFIRNTATTILAIDHEIGVTKYFGDYDYYRTKASEDKVSAHTAGTGPEPEAIVARNSKSEHRRKQEERRESQRREKELKRKAAKLEARIDEWDAEKGRLLKELDDSAAGTDFATVGVRIKELDDFIDSASEEWNELADALENTE